MPELDPAVELGRILARHGMPLWRVTRAIQEVSEHLEDLEAEARLTGHSPEAARSIAHDRLGNVERLAQAMFNAGRSSSWPGRHPLISLICLPLPMFVVLFLGLIWVGVEVSGVAAWSERRHSLPEPDWAIVGVGFYVALAIALSVTAGVTAWLARRCHCGFRWIMIGCGVVFAHAFVFNTGFTVPPGIEHGHFWIGYRLRWLSPPELMAWAVPLFGFALWYVHRRRVARSVALTPMK